MSKPISQLPALINSLFTDVREVLFETAERVKVRLSEAGKPSPGASWTPGQGGVVQWDSEKQRRAFFATNGFGGGIPHVRRGSEANWWKTERVEFGTVLSGKHPAGAVEGIPGGWQSRIHRNRWNNTTRVLFEELAKIPHEMSNKFSVRANNA